MARAFTSTNHVTCSVGNNAFAGSGEFTALSLARKTTDGSFDAFLALLTSGSATNAFFGNWSTNVLAYDDNNSSSNLSTVPCVVADNWCLFGWSKATGTAIIRYHKYVYDTGVWTHTDGSGTLAGWSTPTSGFVRHGSDGDPNPLAGDIEMTALFDVNLSDAQIENCAYSLDHILALAPRGLWLFDQSDIGQPVMDYTGGGANQSSISGTSVSTSAVPIFNRHGHIYYPRTIAAVAPPAANPYYYRHLQRVAAS